MTVCLCVCVSVCDCVCLIPLLFQVKGPFSSSFPFFSCSNQSFWIFLLFVFLESGVIVLWVKGHSTFCTRICLFKMGESDYVFDDVHSVYTGIISHFISEMCSVNFDFSLLVFEIIEENSTKKNHSNSWKWTRGCRDQFFRRFTSRTRQGTKILQDIIHW